MSLAEGLQKWRAQLGSLLLITLFMAGASTPLPAHAILVVVDDPVLGPMSLLLDTETNLEWLRLDRPENFVGTWEEWDAAMASDPLYAAFHFGTSAEIRALWDHGSVPADTGPTNMDYTPESFDAMIPFVELVGGFHRPASCDSTVEPICQVQVKAWRDEIQQQAAFAFNSVPPDPITGTLDSVGSALPDTHTREAWIARAVPEPIDTLDQAFGDFAFGQGGGPVWGQSFEAFSDHIGSVTLLAAGTPGNFFLLVTAARVDVLAPGGVSPDFNDIRFTSSLIELPNVGPDFQEISLDVDADMIIGEKIFIVADMFSEGASGRIGFQAANALTNDAIPSGDLLWIIEENVPQNATELTDLNVDGAFTALFSDIAIRIAVPEPTALQMQMVALLAVFVLVATRQRRLDRALCVLKIRPPCSGTGSLGPTCQND